MQFRTAVAFTLLFAIQPSKVVAASWNEATQLFTQHDYVRACAEFEKLDEKTPGNASIHYMLGKCYRNLGKTHEAQSQFEWVAKNAPNAQTRELAQGSLEELGSIQTSAGHLPGPSPASSGGAPPKDFGGSPSAAISEAAKSGWSPCPGGCLTAASSGWHKQHVDGHPDSDWWMSYKTEDGTGSYTQAHIGHIIKDGTDTGACPVCHGTGWVKR